MALLSGWDYNMAFIRYGDWWRRHMRAFHQFFNSKAVGAFEPVKLKTRRQLLRNLLDTPENFSEHLKYSVGRVIMDNQAVYAIEIKPENDQFIIITHLTSEGFGRTVIPCLWLVDIFPILKRLPDWLPGIPFKNFAKKYRDLTQDLSNIPFNIVKNRESPDYSFVSTSLERLRRLQDFQFDEETVIKNVSGTAYAAGANTVRNRFFLSVSGWVNVVKQTYSAALQAVVALILYPETQKKLQEELDRVLGDRLPNLEDRKDLPYLNAFLAEVMRWRPPLPLGVPHAVQEDDVYGEYFIPKGSIIIADSWQILRDEKYGPNPEEFNPERFFQPGVPWPTEQFGFGRRFCPGRFFAENANFLFMAAIFKVFNITLKKDENGNDIPVSEKTIESGVP
ncbi:hypothetical protein Clacol_007803 [Clathrus columnatus]|uniref:Cytochrome P450 n=1 Tax=Clathrus columnatus TaxID=1419009 RepID=A0AAV5AJ57_9AGAM|nr:hypothetical protein Clacol_007803 [Clathrus columnatus]